MTRIKPLLALAGLSAAALALPAAAHHSFAMFDNSKNVTLKGVVTEFQYANPHSWIEMTVRDASGADTHWSIEGGSPNALGRQGWKRSSLKPGDAVVVVAHPLRDGTNGGSWVTVTVNGAKIGQ